MLEMSEHRQIQSFCPPLQQRITDECIMNQIFD
jgi:hypothetical protein